MLNITVALLGHHLTLLPQKIYGLAVEAIPPAVCTLDAILIIYFGTVLMFLFAAEAVNLFVGIVLVFTKINYYVIKATLIAWSKQN